MKYYQELTVLPSAEIPAFFIWSKLYQKIHLGLASELDEDGTGWIGVSFPDYHAEDEEMSEGEKCALGRRLRLFSDERERLETLDIRSRLRPLSDYVHITSIRPVPTRAVRGYATYSRFHQVSGTDKEARRFARRHEISENEARRLFPKQKFQNGIPYIQLKSLTNQNPFRLFIQKERREESAMDGFNSYGLSLHSTVPEFA